MEHDQHEITKLLQTLGAGESGSAEELFASVYDTLRQIAHGQRRRWRGAETLQTTALIHEAYLKLTAGGERRWEDRGHFYAVACRAMRQILIDWARQSKAAKRGGAGAAESLSRAELPAIAPAARAELLALDQALDRLEAVDPRLVRVVECRFFGGMSVEETAQTLGISTATVKRDWRTTRAWLYDALTAGGAPGI